MAMFRDLPEAIFADLERRGLGRETAEQVIATDEKWRALIDEGNKLRSDRNRISREIAAAKKAGDDTKPLLEQGSPVWVCCSSTCAGLRPPVAGTGVEPRSPGQTVTSFPDEQELARGVRG